MSPSTSPGAAPVGIAQAPTRRTATTGAATGAAGQRSGASSGGQARTSTVAAAAGAAFGSSSTLRSSTAYRPSQEPYLVGLPSSGSAALDYGAYIVPGSGVVRTLRGLRPGAAFAAGEPDLFSLLGIPDFLREGRAYAARRAGSEANGLPDAQEVLGQQATRVLDGGGGLTFGELPLLALGLVVLASFLLVGAVLPPGVVARTSLGPATYARAREPMALAAIGILLPVAFVALVVALS